MKGGKIMTSSNTRKLVESAILIAIATILSMIKIIDFPWGGGITIFAMLPIILISYRYGMKWGFFSAFVFGVLQLAIGLATNAFGLTFGSLILMLFLDYIVAYTALGLGGLFRNKLKSAVLALTLGVIVAVFVRYVSHMISGVIFFGSYAEWFFGDESSGFSMTAGKFFLDNFSGMGLSIIYSVVLNGMTMLCEMAITVVGAVVIGKIPQLNNRFDKDNANIKMNGSPQLSK